MVRWQERRATRVVAATALSAIAALAWIAVIFSDDGESILEADHHRFVLVDKTAAAPANAAKTAAKMNGKHVKKVTKQNLVFERTTGSASWPSEKNPLKDFDADFLGPDQGFPTSTASAEWPFTKNPLLGFDEGFKDSWKGWEGPEHNVYANLPAQYPFVETQLLPGSPDYENWKNGGAVPETNVFNNGYQFPDY